MLVCRRVLRDLGERGRDLSQVLSQYVDLVKVMMMMIIILQW